MVSPNARRFSRRQSYQGNLMTNYLDAMKATAIPEAWSGVWFVAKLKMPNCRVTPRHGKPVVLPCGTYTYLKRLTDSTLYQIPPGDVVMEDTPFELRTHLGFVLHAYGKVLVTGLGLGCVIRGLLANDKVEHITCIENSSDVLTLVAPYMPTDRLTIIEADALKWTAQNKEHFDCGWHDLWTNRDEGEPHLDVWHTRLINNCRETVRQQGAWAYSREMKRYLQKFNFPWIG
jgi:hypothetical protein